jgi:hypothetical protein
MARTKGAGMEGGRRRQRFVSRNTLTESNKKVHTNTSLALSHTTFARFQVLKLHNGWKAILLAVF